MITHYTKCISEYQGELPSYAQSFHLFYSTILTVTSYNTTSLRYLLHTGLRKLLRATEYHYHTGIVYNSAHMNSVQIMHTDIMHYFTPCYDIINKSKWQRYFNTYHYGGYAQTQSTYLQFSGLDFLLDQVHGGCIGYIHNHAVVLFLQLNHARQSR